MAWLCSIGSTETIGGEQRPQQGVTRKVLFCLSLRDAHSVSDCDSQSTSRLERRATHDDKLSDRQGS